MASWDKCEPSYETIHKLCELFAFKSFVAERAIRIKSPVNSCYFQPLFFARCQYPDYKAFLHWRVIQSYLYQQGSLCMELLHKKFNKSISCSEFKRFYIGVLCLYPGLSKYIFEVLKVTVEF